MGAVTQSQVPLTVEPPLQPQQCVPILYFYYYMLITCTEFYYKALYTHIVHYDYTHSLRSPLPSLIPFFLPLLLSYF